MVIISYEREESPPARWISTHKEIQKWSDILQKLQTDSTFNKNDAEPIRKIHQYQRRSKMTSEKGICCNTPTTPSKQKYKQKRHSLRKKNQQIKVFIRYI